MSHEFTFGTDFSSLLPPLHPSGNIRKYHKKKKKGNHKEDDVVSPTSTSITNVTFTPSPPLSPSYLRNNQPSPQHYHSPQRSPSPVSIECKLESPMTEQIEEKSIETTTKVASSPKRPQYHSSPVKNRMKIKESPFIALPMQIGIDNLDNPLSSSETNISGIFKLFMEDCIRIFTKETENYHSVILQAEIALTEINRFIGHLKRPNEFMTGFSCFLLDQLVPHFGVLTRTIRPIIKEIQDSIYVEKIERTNEHWEKWLTNTSYFTMVKTQEKKVEMLRQKSAQTLDRNIQMGKDLNLLHQRILRIIDKTSEQLLRASFGGWRDFYKVRTNTNLRRAQLLASWSPLNVMTIVSRYFRLWNDEVRRSIYKKNNDALSIKTVTAEEKMAAAETTSNIYAIEQRELKEIEIAYKKICKETETLKYQVGLAKTYFKTAEEKKEQLFQYAVLLSEIASSLGGAILEWSIRLQQGVGYQQQACGLPSLLKIFSVLEENGALEINQLQNDSKDDRIQFTVFQAISDTISDKESMLLFRDVLVEENTLKMENPTIEEEAEEKPETCTENCSSKLSKLLDEELRQLSHYGFAQSLFNFQSTAASQIAILPFHETRDQEETLSETKPLTFPFSKREQILFSIAAFREYDHSSCPVSLAELLTTSSSLLFHPVDNSPYIANTHIKKATQCWRNGIEYSPERGSYHKLGIACTLEESNRACIVRNGACSLVKAVASWNSLSGKMVLAGILKPVTETEEKEFITFENVPERTSNVTTLETGKKEEEDQGAASRRKSKLRDGTPNHRRGSIVLLEDKTSLAVRRTDLQPQSALLYRPPEQQIPRKRSSLDDTRPNLPIKSDIFFSTLPSVDTCSNLLAQLDNHFEKCNVIGEECKKLKHLSAKYSIRAWQIAVDNIRAEEEEISDLPKIDSPTRLREPRLSEALDMEVMRPFLRRTSLASLSKETDDLTENPIVNEISSTQQVFGRYETFIKSCRFTPLGHSPSRDPWVMAVEDIWLLLKLLNLTQTTHIERSSFDRRSFIALILTSAAEQKLDGMPVSKRIERIFSAAVERTQTKENRIYYSKDWLLALQHIFPTYHNTLRTVFHVYCSYANDKGPMLLSCKRWIDFLTDYKLIDLKLTVDDAKYVFTSSQRISSLSTSDLSYKEFCFSIIGVAAYKCRNPFLTSGERAEHLIHKYFELS